MKSRKQPDSSSCENAAVDLSGAGPTAPESWTKPSAEQRLSHRTIFRIQEIANRLCKDLQLTSLFLNPDGEPGLQNVFFVQLSDDPQWDFKCGMLATWDLSRLSTWLTHNIKILEPLFEASPGLYIDFKSLILGAQVDANALDFKAAHSILVNAIESISYSGTVLQSMKEIQENSPDERWWWIRFKADQTDVSEKTIGSLDVWGWRKTVEAPEISSRKDKPTPIKRVRVPAFNLKAGLDNLFLKFIDPFMLGVKPATNCDEEMWPYGKGTDEFAALAVPIYDFLDVEQPDKSGTLLGWIFLVLNLDDPKVSKWALKNGSFSPPELGPSELGISFGIRNFARELREYQTIEAMEGDWETARNPLEFVQQNFGRCTGWEHDDKIRTDDEIISLATTLFFVFLDANGGIWRAGSEVQPEALILRIRDNQKNGSDTRRRIQFLCLRKGRRTTVPSKAERIEEYALLLADIAGWLFDDADLRYRERIAAQNQGQSKTFHDYSKDLNVLDDQLSRYANEAVEVRKSVEAEAEKLINSESISKDAVTALQRIKQEAARLGVPQFDYILRLRFLMSHLRVKTEGRLYEAPEWCWKLLASGTKRDIYLIIRALVWLPAGWSRYEEQRKTLPEAEGPDESFTWARLFLFDEDEDERQAAPSIQKAINEVMEQLFFAWKIRQDDYAACFPPPSLNPEVSWSQRVLWSALDEDEGLAMRSMPPARLLPLLVFALRTAFEHAYLRTLLRTRNISTLAEMPRRRPREIRLWDEIPAKQRIHRIHVDFPAVGLEPDLHNKSVDELIPADLPYGQWSKHMDHYYRVSKPWQWTCRRVLGKMEENDSDAWHYRITLEAKR